MFCKIDSLYICVNDMERAIKFYEEFFEQEVSEKGIRFIYALMIWNVQLNSMKNSLSKKYRKKEMLAAVSK